MLTRDNLIWTAGLVGGALTFVVTHMEKFPYIGPDWQGTVELIAFVCALVSAKAGMSPLPKSDSDDQRIDLGKVLGL